MKHSSLDKELIHDIVLYRQNKIGDNKHLFDIEIKRYSFRESQNDYNYKDNYKELIVDFDRILIIDNKRYSPVSDDMIIDMIEYKRLLRGKKLKEIGI